MCVVQATIEVDSGPHTYTWCRWQVACAVGDLEAEAYAVACMCMMQAILEMGSRPRVRAWCRQQEACVVWIEGGVTNAVQRQRR